MIDYGWLREVPWDAWVILIAALVSLVLWVWIGCVVLLALWEIRHRRFPTIDRNGIYFDERERYFRQFDDRGPRGTM